MYRIKVVSMFLSFLLLALTAGQPALAQMAYPGEELEYDVHLTVRNPQARTALDIDCTGQGW